MQNIAPFRRYRLWGVVLSAAVLYGCGGDGGGPMDAPIEAIFDTSRDSAPEGLVILGGEAMGDVVSLDVVLGGPHPQPELAAFAFDIAVDARIVQLLSCAPGDLFPEGSAECLAGQRSDRIVVGAARLDAGASAVRDGEVRVAVIELRVISRGQTTLSFVGAPQNPAGDPGPAALDPDDNVVEEIRFDTGQATIVGI